MITRELSIDASTATISLKGNAGGWTLTVTALTADGTVTAVAPLNHTDLWTIKAMIGEALGNKE